MSINFNPYISQKNTPKTNPHATKNELRANIGVKNWEIQSIKSNSDIVQKAVAPTDPGLLALTAFINATSKMLFGKLEISFDIDEVSDRSSDFFVKCLDSQDKAWDTVEEILNFYKEGEKTSPNGIASRAIYPLIGVGSEAMDEYNDSGLKRRSILKYGVLQKTKEFRPDGKKNITTLLEGRLQEYTQGLAKYNKDSKTGKTMDMRLIFNKGIPSLYLENYTIFEDGSSSSSKQLRFDDKGEMIAYCEDIETSANKSTIGLLIKFDNHCRIYEYAENIENGVVKGKHYILKDGKWIKAESSEV